MVERLVNVERKRERTKKLNCLSMQERKNNNLIPKKRPYSAKPSMITAARCRASVPRLGLLLGMGAGEAHGSYTPPASCPHP